MSEDRGRVGTKYEEEEEERGGGLRMRRRSEKEEEEEEEEEDTSVMRSVTTRASRMPTVKGTHDLFG